MFGQSLSLRTLKAQNDAWFQAIQPTQALVYPSYDPACEKLWEFHRSQAKIRLLLGGNRSGKSETGGYELVSLARRYPGEMFWACSNTLDSIGLYVWPKIKKYLHPQEIKTIAWASRVKDIPSQIRLRDHTVFVFKTYDQKRERFQGAGVKAIWLDEECDRNLFLECLARTTDTQGYIIKTMTPLKGYTWVADELANPNQDQYGADVQTWTISMLENKYIPEEEKQRYLRLYTKDEIQKRVYGQFMRLEGAVWKEFNSDRHVIDPFPIPEDWRRIRAIDFGYDNPFVCLWLAMSPKGVVYVYQEYYQAGTLLQDHARAMRDVPGIIEATVADHDAQSRAELEAQEIYSLPAQKEIELGVQTVNRRFKANCLQIFRSCEKTIQEARKYHYKPGTDKPEKKDDHTQDALRYGVMHLMTPVTEPVWRN